MYKYVVKYGIFGKPQNTIVVVLSCLYSLSADIVILHSRANEVSCSASLPNQVTREPNQLSLLEFLYITT